MMISLSGILLACMKEKSKMFKHNSSDCYEKKAKLQSYLELFVE